jgi:hypothetical protein
MNRLGKPSGNLFVFVIYTFKKLKVGRWVDGVARGEW